MLETRLGNTSQTLHRMVFWWEVKQKIEKVNILKNIILLVFENQFELASTFLRFQEHYESPEFRGRVFTLDEYKEWYIKQKGSFSYYTDWNGFNIPSHIISPFKEGKFDPLSEKELGLINVLKEETGNFYIIGVHKELELPRRQQNLKHEVAHGLFYTNPQYKTEVQNILSKYDLTDLKKWLKSINGYHDGVLEDECHAFSLTGSTKLPIQIPLELNKSLESIFADFTKSVNLNQQLS